MVLLALGLAHGYCVMKWVKLLKYLRSLSLLGSYLIVQTLLNSFGWKLSKVILLIYTNFDINSEFIKDQFLIISASSKFLQQIILLKKSDHILSFMINLNASLQKGKENFGGCLWDSLQRRGNLNARRRDLPEVSRNQAGLLFINKLAEVVGYFGGLA